MSLTAAEVVALFERRYDYQSARTMLRQTAAQAGLSADGPFGAEQLVALARIVEALGDRAEAVARGLSDAAGPPPAAKGPANPPAAKATPPAEAAPTGDDKKPAPKAEAQKPKDPKARGPKTEDAEAPTPEKS